MEGNAVVLIGRQNLGPIRVMTDEEHVEWARENEPVKKNALDKIHIDRTFVSRVLDLDSIQRKEMNWTRHSFNEMVRMSQREVSFSDDILVAGTGQKYQKEKRMFFQPDFRRVQRKMNSACILLEDILGVSPGHVILAGGAVSAAIWGYHAADADFFLIDVEDPEALIRDLCVMIEKMLRQRYIEEMGEDGEHVGHPMCLFARNQNVTTVYIDVEYHELGENSWKDLICFPAYKIQFIHRVYPTPMHVLGGFDIPSAYYDGHEIYTNFLGLISCSLGMIFVDPSRRSTSYSARLKKYSRRNMKIVMTNTCNKEVLEQKEKQTYFTPHFGLHIQPCKDIKIAIDKDDTFLVFGDHRGMNYHPKGGDYESEDASGNWKTANGLLAWNGKLDQMCWYGTSIEDVFDKPKIKCMRPFFRHQYCSRHIERRWITGTEIEEIYKKEKYGKMTQTLQILEEKIEKNRFKAEERAWRGVTYIRENPGRQWTSSINPIVENVRDYYHPMMMNILKIGLSDKIVTTVFLSWKKNLGVFSTIMFSRDVFRILMGMLRKANAYLILDELQRQRVRVLDK